jgi:FAD/FMN-containing dehydrogenase
LDILRAIWQEKRGAGGSITGEHGVGMEKMELMASQFSDESLEMIRSFKNLFDPGCRFNPGKVLPTGKGCTGDPAACWVGRSN